jgi:chromosome partitioning protein
VRTVKPPATKRKRKKVQVPDAPGKARIIAIANQKGGVGKSTTAVSLGAALAELGFRVLVVDLDPQGNASTGLGIRHEHREMTSYDIIVAEASITDAVVHSPIAGLDAVPSTIDLAGAEIELVSQFSREGRLKRALEPMREGSYDFIFLDCPPSLGLITVNALTAAEELIVPIQCEYYALEGLGQLLRNVGLVQQNINPDLRLSGIVMTMFDSRTRLSEQVVDEVRRFFGDLVYDVIIPRTVRLSEAPGFGQPITTYDSRSKGAESYRKLAEEVASRRAPDRPMPTLDQLPLVVAPIPEPFSAEAEQQASEPAVHAEPEAEPEPEPELEPEPEGEAEPVGGTAPDAASESEPERDAAAPEPAPTAPRDVQPEPAPPVSEPASTEEEIWETAEPGEDEEKVRRVTATTGHPTPRVVVIDEDEELPIQEEPPTEGSTEAERALGATLRDEKHGGKRRWRLFRKGGE